MLTDVTYGLELADGLLRNPSLAGRLLKSISMPGGVLIMGIRRNGEAIIPNGDTNLQFGDVLTLVGKPEDLKQAREMLVGPNRRAEDAASGATLKSEAPTR
jgi:Trk K+ transport system NAD-binding subunit